MFLWIGAKNKAVHVQICCHKVILIFKAINQIFRRMESSALSCSRFLQMILFGIAQVQSWQLFSSSCGFGPINGHHVAKVASDGPPDLTFIHDLLLGTHLKSNLGIESILIGVSTTTKWIWISMRPKGRSKTTLCKIH